MRREPTSARSVLFCLKRHAVVTWVTVGRHGGLAGLAVLGRDAAGRQTASMASVDVVVVSAGLSGLIAARELPKKGKIVAVLEAKGRTGGRMVNQKVAGDGVIDLGSQWGENPLPARSPFG